MRSRQTAESQTNITARQREQALKNSKSRIPGLQNIPDTYFIPLTGPSGPAARNSGILGVGLLKPNPIDIGDYSPTSVNSLGKPNFVLNQRVTWDYFFIEYNNPDTTPIQGKIKNFSVIRTLNGLTTNQVSKMLGTLVKNVTGLTKDQYDNGTFTHPYYTNSNGQPLVIRYAEIPIVIQRTPGRLDNVPIGSPNFDSTPDGVISTKGPIPSAPLVNFSTATGATLPFTIYADQSVEYVDLTPMSPWQIAPTGWIWDFGSSANPTGGTGRNAIVSYNSLGTYSVSLTAINQFGSSVLIRDSFVTVIATTTTTTTTLAPTTTTTTTTLAPTTTTTSTTTTTTTSTTTQEPCPESVNVILNPAGENQAIITNNDSFVIDVYDGYLDPVYYLGQIEGGGTSEPLDFASETILIVKQGTDCQYCFSLITFSSEVCPTTTTTTTSTTTTTTSTTTTTTTTTQEPCPETIECQFQPEGESGIRIFNRNPFDLDVYDGEFLSQNLLGTVLRGDESMFNFSSGTVLLNKKDTLCIYCFSSSDPYGSVVCPI